MARRADSGLLSGTSWSSVCSPSVAEGFVDDYGYYHLECLPPAGPNCVLLNNSALLRLK